MCRFTMQRSERIIADSEFACSEILHRFPMAENKVVVIHCGVDLELKRPHLEGEPPFILFVGTHEERKGVLTLVRAYSLLRHQGRIPHKLVCVGKPGYGWDRIKASVEGSPVREHIEIRGYETRSKVLELYQSADLFVYPSVYEGFGLPILEAMACGTPVVCTRAASMPEVAGNAAEYFEASNAEDLAGAIERVLSSAEKRGCMRDKGLERVKIFSWDECARRHCAVYRKVMEESKMSAVTLFS
jgi:glycosyltransferase involved in cell wall biosynthesis